MKFKLFLLGIATFSFAASVDGIYMYKEKFNPRGVVGGTEIKTISPDKIQFLIQYTNPRIPFIYHPLAKKLFLVFLAIEDHEIHQQSQRHRMLLSLNTLTSLKIPLIFSYVTLLWTLVLQHE